MPLWFLVLIIFILSGCDRNPAMTTVHAAARANVALGLAYLQQEEVAEAKQKLLLAQQQAPEDPVVLDGLGFFSQQTGNVFLAKQYYQQAVERAPHDGPSQNNLGVFLCQQGDYQQALAHFELALADIRYLNPADAAENAGRCALKNHDKSASCRFFQVAAHTDPQRAYLKSLCA